LVWEELRRNNPGAPANWQILVHGQEHALALRNMLIKEHLGPGAPANPDDFNNVFEAFKM